DGTALTIVPSPNTNATADFFTGIACTSDTSCWATGYATSGGSDTAFIARWDGATWSVSPTPSISGNSDLRSVSCASTTLCWAVGYSSTPTGVASENVDYQPLILQWNGVAWAVATAPSNLPVTSTLLYGVACGAPTQCWAVGYVSNSTTAQPYTAHWDGTAWSTGAAATPNTSQTTVLSAVACGSPASCIGVGYTSPSSSQRQTLAERWDGTSWTLLTPPAVATTFTTLQAVACAGATNCWLAGFGQSPGSPQTLVEHWDGGTLSVTPTQNAHSTFPNYLYGVACSSSDCLTVGYWAGLTQDTLGGHTLVELRGSSPQPSVPEWPWPPLGVLLAVLATTLRNTLSRRKHRP
ncbi:MAG: hypothetical protein ABR498_06330, partial [Candidatus Dormibacteria bacterium]